MARRSREERASEVRRLPGVRTGGQVRNQGGVAGPQQPKVELRRKLPGSGRPPTGAPAKKRGRKKDKALTLGTATVDRSELGAAQPMGGRLGISDGPPPSGKPAAGGPRGLPPTPPDRGAAAQAQKRALPGKKAGETEVQMPESEFMAVAAGRALPGGEREGAVFEIARNPSADEMTKSAPVGRIQTPDYSVVKDKDGKFGEIQFTEAGKVKVEQYKQKMVQKIGKFPGSDDPNSPKPPVELGEPFFNPYNNTWTQPEGMEFEDLLEKHGG